MYIADKLSTRSTVLRFGEASIAHDKAKLLICMFIVVHTQS